MSCTTTTRLSEQANFYNDFEGYDSDESSDRRHNKKNNEDDDDEEDDDDYLSLTTTLQQRDWRDFRRQLAAQNQQDRDDDRTANKKSASQVSVENRDVLASQNRKLHGEYQTAVWAHEIAMPEVGGLIVRLPLEVELQRNYKHSLTGHRLRNSHDNDDDDNDDNNDSTTSASHDLKEWYQRAQTMIEQDLTFLSEQAAVDGQIDATTLNDEMAELLQLYLDHQETWQEVCLVLEHDSHDSSSSSSTALVLNRPMALKLTENLGQLVLLGAYQMDEKTGNAKRKRRNRPDLHKFMKAFGQECGVYIGGPDDQDQPAELIHGIADLPGSTEIAPGTGIYRGGLAAATEGVLQGKYKPLEFRFFVGRHSFPRTSAVQEVVEEEEEDDDDEEYEYDSNVVELPQAASAGVAMTMDLSVVLGKYQAIACARCLALKQCISLPKPLWHEVLELCGGEMFDISQLELNKEGDTNFIQIIDDDEEEEDEIVDELGELSVFDDVEDDEDDDGNDDDYYYGGR
eukprot:CAMPEP_0172440788 /NCGR_PEP_ID=MMETSP1065-20121228/1401_1 /TAXON_ID=265537 /ORGANISM="Amphiprora paludosa, Strain CCMP125" /LENGTH=512 /DNA_ID=CAMNT_0013189815 /DNA_START=902 /DNA_END=2440 /DNA_ORIENTATION=-